MRKAIIAQFKASEGEKPELDSLLALDEWILQFTLQIGVYFLRQREEIIAKQAAELEVKLAELQMANSEQTRLLELMQQVAIPIAPIYEGILAVPLIGAIDSGRAQLLSQRVLDEVARTKCEMVIVDITGVPVFDSDAALHILKVARSLRLLGAEMILTGLSAQVALTITQMGMSLEGLVSLRTIQDGLAYAQARRRPEREPRKDTGAVKKGRAQV